jgi:Raf kinase inhibitor-like YbhB/YbcL family protein
MMRLFAPVGLVLAATVGTMQLQSSDFTEGGSIPARAMARDCGGQNRSPDLAWSGVPGNVKSFALIVHDPDAPVSGGFYHWVVYNLPGTTRHLAPDAQLAPEQLGATSAGRPGYYGPCPPRGPTHHYSFTLYALDIAHISTTAPLNADQLETRISGHVLARGVLRGTAATH